MDARKELNQAKIDLNISTDQELADILKVNKSSINNWVKRNSIPERWRMVISHHVHPLAKLDLTGDKVEEPTIPYNASTLPADIVSIVEILKELDTKQRRDVMRCVLEIEAQ